jgi:predicted Zn-dependent protease with MMP-like domain
MTQRDWSSALAPSLTDFEALADHALAGLPQQFRELCGGVVIKVDDFPDDQTLDEMDCETEFDVLGLFRGRGLAQMGATPMTGELPNMIFLYRRPILDYWAEHEETLGRIIIHVLVHEIGHHFGLSDEDMEELERRSE